jgi:hypothetical protein
MSYVIDRRKNSGGKNLNNKQKFIKRAKEAIKEQVNNIAKGRNIKDIDLDKTKIKVRSKTLDEPSFGHDSKTGKGNVVVPGNKQYAEGDLINKPTQDSAQGSGREGSQDGEGNDSFTFVLSREEFLDLFFEDLELPDLVKKMLKEVKVKKNKRGGYTNEGSPSNLDIRRTLKQSMGRRIGLNRPKREDIEALEAEIEENKKSGLNTVELEQKLEAMKRKLAAIPWIDPFDTRYRLHIPVMLPNTSAVVFCLMDVSGSMSEHEKEVAKVFFILLNLFLQRKYDKVEIVFIRHTQIAKEVDEQEFFYGTETGGTMVSSALVEMIKIIESRYDINWNIYVAQCSDGDNWSGDNKKCIELLHNIILPRVQYYAYLEIKHPFQSDFGSYYNKPSDLWADYESVAKENPKFAMKRVADKNEVFPIFQELFQKER